MNKLIKRSACSFCSIIKSGIYRAGNDDIHGYVLANALSCQPWNANLLPQAIRIFILVIALTHLLSLLRYTFQFSKLIKTQNLVYDISALDKIEASSKDWHPSLPRSPRT